MNEIHKAQADRIQHIFDSFEKARTVHPIGMIKEMGGRKYIKTPEGWKYHGKGRGAKAQAHATEHGKKEGQSSSSQATTEDKAKKLLAELKQRSESGQEGMLIDPAAKDAPHIKQLVDQGAVSIENNRISYVQPASSSQSEAPKKKAVSVLRKQRNPITIKKEMRVADTQGRVVVLKPGDVVQKIPGGLFQYREGNRLTELEDLTESARWAQMEEGTHFEVGGQAETQSQSTDSNLPAVGSTVHVAQQGGMTTQMLGLKNKPLKVIEHFDTGLISSPKQIKVKDAEGNVHELDPSVVTQGAPPEPTFRDVLANPEGKALVESIEEYIGDLRDQPGRKEHMEGLESVVKELEEKMGYKYDISEQKAAYEEATKSSSKVKNTAKVPGGDRVQKIGIGGRYDKEPIRMPGISDLKSAEGLKKIEEGLKQLTIAERAKFLESSLKSVKDDAGKVSSYQKFTDRERLAAKIKLKDLRNKYVGKTTAEDKRVKVEIDSTNKMKINGKEVEIDDDSSFVKLGGGGRQSASGGMYSAGHFDGQLQGRGYVGKTKMLRSAIQNGKSIGEAVKSLMETSRDKAEAKKVVEHLGLTKFI